MTDDVNGVIGRITTAQKEEDFPDPKHMRGLTESVEARRQEEGKRKKEEARRLAESQANEQLRELKDLTSSRILQKADAGSDHLDISIGQGEYHPGVIVRLRAALEERGYRTEIEEETVDHGDSAAPCVRTYDILRIRW